MYYLIGLHNGHETISSDCRKKGTKHVCLLGVDYWLLLYWSINVFWNTISFIFIFQMVIFRHESLRSAPTSYSVSLYPCGLMMLENSIYATCDTFHYKFHFPYPKQIKNNKYFQLT